MRTEHEMFNLILNVAKNDERIRAVFMNGSRTNPNAIKDIFQDYDIVYVVEETKSFREGNNWIDQFGERLYMQYPDENSYYKNDVDNSYGWLIQFTDGNRHAHYILDKFKVFGNQFLLCAIYLMILLRM